MPYDHSTKIGNQGDVVKHVALFAAIRHLLEGWPTDQVFSYADAHAGRPTYRLPKNGEWRHGIGVFSELPALVEDRRDRESTSGLGVIGEFDQAFIRRDLEAEADYHGSSGIAYYVLQAASISFRMTLWEKEPTAAQEVGRHFQDDQSRVTVVCGDGYEGGRTADPITLALIDPPTLESGPVLETLDRLNERGEPFLCWTPRTSRSFKPTTPGGPGSAAEAGTSTRFVEEASKRGRCLRVQWYAWGHRTPGCYITVSAGLGGVVAHVVERVSSLMGWEYDSGSN